MSHLFKLWFDILRLRSGPDTIPYSLALFKLSLIAHFITGILLASFSLDLASALIAALLGTLVMVAYCHLLLLLHRKQPRLIQTLTALAGCEVLLGVLSLPLAFWFQFGSGDQTLTAMLALLILGWNLSVAGHIFRHATERNAVIGFLFALGYITIALTLGGG
ncbi:MAG: hypothetical protein HQL48_11490 [Gammaproteobacteria bacterium]|nr:hypothetical protein [Gammaproteobacteria bacterium]